MIVIKGDCGKYYRIKPFKRFVKKYRIEFPDDFTDGENIVYYRFMNLKLKLDTI